MAINSQEKNWTVLVYIVADHAGVAPEEIPAKIDEVAHVEVDNILWAADLEKVNVAVQVDFTQRPGVLRVLADGEAPERTLLRETKENHRETLNEFITYVRKHCPPDPDYPDHRYLLLLWGHGGGPVGFFSDSNGPALTGDRPDTLSLLDLQCVLEHFRTTFGKRLDILLVKGCCISTVETAWQVQGLVDFVLASQARVPLRAWTYGELFAALRPDAATSATNLLEAVGRQFLSSGQRNMREEIPFSLLVPSGAGQPADKTNLAKEVASVARAIESIGADHPEVLKALDRARPESGGDKALLDVVQMCTELRKLQESAPYLQKIADLAAPSLALEQRVAAIVQARRPAVSKFSGLGIFHFPQARMRRDSFANDVTRAEYAALALFGTGCDAWPGVAFKRDTVQQPAVQTPAVQTSPVVQSPMSTQG